MYWRDVAPTDNFTVSARPAPAADCGIPAGVGVIPTYTVMWTFAIWWTIENEEYAGRGASSTAEVSDAAARPRIRSRRFMVSPCTRPARLQVPSFVCLAR